MTQESAGFEKSRLLKRTIQEAIIAIARPYVYHELPGWGRVYNTFVGGYKRNWLWSGSRARVIRGKLHNHLMSLDISNWADRSAFFLGRWYDLSTQMLIAATVRPGDVVVDVGANRGMFALAASHRVGSLGRVICFEPNPKCVEILARDLQLNSIRNVIVHNIGLSDENTELKLSIPRINSGEASFGLSAYNEVDEISVPVAIGDELLDDIRPVVIKIDVEGYEPRVLNGLTETIKRSRPVIVTEVIEQHLLRCGSSVEKLFGPMEKLGYQGFQLSMARTGMRYQLRLSERRSSEDCDIAWLHPHSPISARLRSVTG